jgi:hypothetical protein
VRSYAQQYVGIVCVVCVHVNVCAGAQVLSSLYLLLRACVPCVCVVNVFFVAFPMCECLGCVVVCVCM